MLNFSRGGPFGGTPLLLVHPMGADLSFWDACRADWERDLDCIAPDLRCAGLSPGAERPPTIEDNAADLAALCAALGIGRVVAVGCAVGAMVAAAFAGSGGVACAGLVLANPGLATQPVAREALAARADALRAGGLAAVLPGVVDNAFLGCPDDERRRDFAARFAAQDADRYALQIEGMLDADTSGHLSRVACPLLVATGGNDRLLPPSHGEAIRDRVPGCDYVLVPDGAHFIPYQRPAEFAALVRDFLARVADFSG